MEYYEVHEMRYYLEPQKENESVKKSANAYVAT